MSLPGQRARIEIFEDAKKIIDKYPKKTPDDIMTIIGVKLGLTPAKSREYYRDVINFRRIEQDLEIDDEEEALKDIDNALEKDLKMCGLKRKET